MPPRGTKRKAADSVEAKGPIDSSSLQSPPGSVFVAGSGDYGQLGLGEDVTEKFRPGPLAIDGDEKIVFVASGGMHTCILTASGKVWSWGVNDEGALGRTADRDGGENTPGLADVPKGHKVVALSCGDSHTMALTEMGAILGWGSFRDSTGVMGFTAEIKVQRTPMVLYDPADHGGVRMTKIASGTDHVAALGEDGLVYTFGCGQQGQLGRVGERQSERSSKGGSLATLLTPTAVAGLSRKRGGRKIVDIACGSYHTIAIGAAGDVFAWGLNNYGQLSLSADTTCYFAPEAAKKLKGASKVAGGQHHSLALDASGTLVSFGRPTYGRLGQDGAAVSSDEACPDPKPVSGIEAGLKVESFDAGIAVSGLCADNGRVYVWGCNSSYQLAKGDEDEDELLPAIIKETKAFNNNFCTQVSFGGQHTVLLGYQKDKKPEAEKKPEPAPAPVPAPVPAPTPVPEPVAVPELVPEPVAVPAPVTEPVAVPAPVPTAVPAPAVAAAAVPLPPDSP